MKKIHIDFTKGRRNLQGGWRKGSINFQISSEKNIFQLQRQRGTKHWMSSKKREKTEQESWKLDREKVSFRGPFPPAPAH